MSNITIRQLEYFLAVIEHGSISNASREIHISQAAVSMAIQQLERSLNASLLTRSASQSAAPTSAGESLIPHARNVIRAVKDAVDTVHNDFSEMRGTLRLAVLPTISPYIVPALVKHFHNFYPNVRIEIDELHPPELHDAIRKGQADLGILYHLSLQTAFPYRVIKEVHQHVAISAKHRLADEEQIHLADIIDETLIPLNLPPSMMRITDAIKALGLQPRFQWPSQNYETVRSMVAHGLGWSYINLVPQTEITYDGEEIRYIPIADPMPYNAIVGITHPELEANTRIKAALDYLISREG